MKLNPRFGVDFFRFQQKIARVLLARILHAEALPNGIDTFIY